MKIAKPNRKCLFIVALLSAPFWGELYKGVKQEGLKLEASLFSSQENEEERVKSLREKLIADAIDRNRDLCQKQTLLLKEIQGDIYKKKYSEEEVKGQSLKVLAFSHQMTDELSLYNLKNKDKLLLDGHIDPKFLLKLEKVQSPCVHRPQLLERIVSVLSKNIDRKQDSKNWMVYRTTEFSMKVVKSLDSFEALQASLNLLEALGRNGHLKRQDVQKVQQFKRKVGQLNNEFQRDISQYQGGENGLKRTLRHWENKKVLTRLELRNYLSDISRRYPAQEKRFGEITLPEII